MSASSSSGLVTGHHLSSADIIPRPNQTIHQTSNYSPTFRASKRHFTLDPSLVARAKTGAGKASGSAAARSTGLQSGSSSSTDPKSTLVRDDAIDQRRAAAATAEGRILAWRSFQPTSQSQDGRAQSTTSGSRAERSPTIVPMSSCDIAASVSTAILRKSRGANEVVNSNVTREVAAAVNDGRPSVHSAPALSALAEIDLSTASSDPRRYHPPSSSWYSGSEGIARGAGDGSDRGRGRSRRIKPVRASRLPHSLPLALAIDLALTGEGAEVQESRDERAARTGADVATWVAEVNEHEQETDDSQPQEVVEGIWDHGKRSTSATVVSRAEAGTNSRTPAVSKQEVVIDIVDLAAVHRAATEEQETQTAIPDSRGRKLALRTPFETNTTSTLTLPEASSQPPTGSAIDLHTLVPIMSRLPLRGEHGVNTDRSNDIEEDNEGDILYEDDASTPYLRRVRASTTFEVEAGQKAPPHASPRTVAGNPKKSSPRPTNGSETTAPLPRHDAEPSHAGVSLDSDDKPDKNSSDVLYSRSRLPTSSVDEASIALWRALHRWRPVTRDYAGAFEPRARGNRKTRSEQAVKAHGLWSQAHRVSSASTELAATCPFASTTATSTRAAASGLSCPFAVVAAETSEPTASISPEDGTESAPSNLLRAFNWSQLELPLDTEREWYGVCFRSVRRDTSTTDDDKELLDTALYHADNLSHEEAISSGGLLMYWYGSPSHSSVNSNLATCLWLSREDAIAASRLPLHNQAIKLTARAYESFELARYRVKKVRGESWVRLEDW